MRVGTIHEITGHGYEILVDVETRSYVLGVFYNGSFLSESRSTGGNADEATVIA